MAKDLREYRQLREFQRREQKVPLQEKIRDRLKGKIGGVTYLWLSLFLGRLL